MSVKPALGLKVQTRLALTPDMRQSLAILRMPAAELQELALREAEENPFLRLKGRVDPFAGADALASVAARPGVVEGLIHQLRQSALPPAVREVAEYLAGALREDGYLDGALEDFAAELGLPEPLLAEGLAALHACEPAGIGARSLAECILLQLVDRGVPPPLATAVLPHLADLAAGRAAGVARRLGIARAEAQRIAALLRGIDPRPLKPEADPSPVLRPDLVVEKAAEGLRVSLARGLPVLEIDRSLAGSGFAADRRARAEALVAALRQRGLTLLAIGRALAARQEAFFHEGVEALRPLTRAALAAELGLHPATLGRAVAGKGLETGGRIYPLTLFFSAAGGRVEEGEPPAARAVGRRIARMILAEPPEAPLSDAGIAARLAEEGIDIARRTVAKYREGMRIPSSRRRRRTGPRKGIEG